MKGKQAGLLGHIQLALTWLGFNAAVFYFVLSENWPTYFLFVAAGLSVVFGLALIFGERELRRAANRRSS